MKVRGVTYDIMTRRLQKIKLNKQNVQECAKTRRQEQRRTVTKPVVAH
jgi:hypothetical protein